MRKSSSVIYVTIASWLFLVLMIACESGNKFNETSEKERSEDSIAFIISGDKMRSIKVKTASNDYESESKIIHVHQSQKNKE